MSGQLDIVDPPILLSEASSREKWLLDQEAWKALFQEMWYLQQEEEPLNGLGNSVLVRWLNDLQTEGENGWSCGVPVQDETWCKHQTNRLDRAVTHVRGHLGLKPYPCEGQCNKENCTARFSSNEYRSAHYQGPDRRKCEWCGKDELRQNLPRHMETCPKKPGQSEKNSHQPVASSTLTEKLQGGA